MDCSRYRCRCSDSNKIMARSLVCVVFNSIELNWNCIHYGTIMSWTVFSHHACVSSFELRKKKYWIGEVVWLRPPDETNTNIFATTNCWLVRRSFVCVCVCVRLHVSVKPIDLMTHRQRFYIGNMRYSFSLRYLQLLVLLAATAIAVAWHSLCARSYLCRLQLNCMHVLLLQWLSSSCDNQAEHIEIVCIFSKVIWIDLTRMRLQ